MKHPIYSLFALITLMLSFCLYSCQKEQPQKKVDALGAFTASSQQQTSANTKTTKSDNSPISIQEKTAKTQIKYEIPAPINGELRLYRKGYTVSYNTDTRCPNWVAWHLTKAHTHGRYQRSKETFTEDTNVPSPRATDADYYNSRFDRGHMCPAGDNKWDETAMRESFLFTNICPQNHGLNKYEWNDVEMLCREWAERYGAIDIVCGPIYDKAAQVRTIGRNRVRVPDRFFKVVLCRQGNGKAIGFIYKNKGVKQPMTESICTVDEVERLTGFDFFPSLDDQTETRIEAEANLRQWN